MKQTNPNEILAALLRRDWEAVRRSILLARLRAEFQLVEVSAEE